MYGFDPVTNYARKESPFDCTYTRFCGVGGKMLTKANVSPVQAAVFAPLPTLAPPKLCPHWCDSLKAIRDKPARQASIQRKTAVGGLRLMEKCSCSVIKIDIKHEKK